MLWEKGGSKEKPVRNDLTIIVNNLLRIGEVSK